MRPANTLTTLCEDYIREHFGLSDLYYVNLRLSVRLFTAWNGEDIRAKELTEKLLCEFLAAYSTDHEPPTVNSKRRHILTIWRYAADRDLCRPPKRIPVMSEPVKIPTAWTIEECERIFAACSNREGLIYGIKASLWWLSLSVCCYWVGERINAMRFTRTVDYDPKRRLLLIQAVNQKTNRTRLIRLPEQPAKLIEAVRNPRNKLLWPWPYHKNTLWTHFRQIVEDAGVPAPREESLQLFHKLRRTSGSYVEANGGDGAKHLCHSREVFERSYKSPMICSDGSQIDLLPIPRISY